MSLWKNHFPACGAAACLLLLTTSRPQSARLPAAAGWGSALAQAQQASARTSPLQGLTEAQAKRLAEAQSALEQAEVAASQYKPALLESARDHFTAILSERPSTLPAMFGLAEAERKLATLDARLGSMSKAMDYYNSYTAWPVGKTDYRAYEGLGRVFLHSKYWRQAEPQFRRAVMLNPASASAHSGLAQALRGLKEIDEAYQEITQARELESGNVEILRAFVHICIGTIKEDGRIIKPEWLEEALRACNEGIGVLQEEWEKNPQEPELLEEIAEFHDFIIGITESQLRGTPPNEAESEMIIRLVRNRQLKQQVESLLADHQSLRIVTYFLQYLPEDLSLLSSAARLQRKLNMQEQARKTCETILKLQPSHEQAREMLNSLSS